MPPRCADTSTPVFTPPKKKKRPARRYEALGLSVGAQVRNQKTAALPKRRASRRFNLSAEAVYFRLVLLFSNALHLDLRHKRPGPRFKLSELDHLTGLLFKSAQELGHD
jgi:hypothetical protein